MKILANNMRVTVADVSCMIDKDWVDPDIMKDYG